MEIGLTQDFYELLLKTDTHNTLLGSSIYKAKVKISYIWQTKNVFAYLLSPPKENLNCIKCVYMVSNYT